MKLTYPEQRVYNFLRTKNFDIKIHDRSHLRNPKTKRPLEIDLYLTNYHIGIEVQSKYHRYHKQRIRDNIKIRLCKQQGLQLLHIYAPITHFKLASLYNSIKELINLKKN